MRAINTKYLTYTNTKPARIKAYDCRGNQVTISIHSDRMIPALDISEHQHRMAAVELCHKMKWSGADHLISGATKEGYVFVFLPERCCPCCDAFSNAHFALERIRQLGYDSQAARATDTVLACIRVAEEAIK